MYRRYTQYPGDVTETGKRDTRERLLAAAAELIAAAPGEDVPLRAICDRAGVRLPTLYHFFGSKAGLLDAVVAHGFETYLSAKREHAPTGDPLEDIRRGWDDHVAFGLENPGFYTLMYGRIRPGSRPTAAGDAEAMLLGLTTALASRGRLRVSPERAAEHVLATNVGVTLALITSPSPDLALSAAVRDAVLAAVAHPDGSAGSGAPQATGTERIREDAIALRAALGTGEGITAALDTLGAPETALLEKWLVSLSGLGEHGDA